MAQARQVPPSLADRFMRVAGACQSCESFLAKHRAASSSLARALLAGEHSAHERALDTARAELDTAQADALARLSALDDHLRDHLEQLVSLHGELSYLSKWIAQVRESHLKLALESTPNLKSGI